MLEVRRLTKRYNSLPAVQDVSFTIAPGQVLGCLGPNGAGKSTTVKMLIGLLEPSSGQVLFNGTDIRSDLVAYRKQLGYVPEEPNLYPYLSGREYLQMVGTLRGMQRKQRPEDRGPAAAIRNALPSRRFHSLVLKRHAAADP